MVTTCGHCGAKLSAGLKFCPACGTKVTGAASKPATRKAATAKAAAAKTATPEALPAKAAPAPAKRTRAKAKAAPIAAAPIEAAPTEAAPVEPATPVCPHCRELNLPDARFCRHCGGAMDGSVTPPRYSPPPSAYDPSYGYPVAPPNRTPWIVAATVLGVLLLSFLYYTVFLDKEAPDATPTATTAAPLPSATTKVEQQLYVVAEANVRNRATSIGTSIVRKEMRGSMLRGTVEIGEDGSTQWLKLADNSGFVAMSNLSANQPPRLAQTFNNRPFSAPYDIQLHASPDGNSPVLETVPAYKTFFLAGITDNDFVEAKRAKGGVGYFNAEGEDLSSNANAAADAAVAAAAAAEAAGYDYAPGQGISLRYVSDFSALRGRTGDQQISISVRPDGGGVAYYTNTGSGKRCTAYLDYVGVRGTYLLFNQNRPPDGNGCGQTPELRLSGDPGDVQADWVMNGSYVMSSALAP